MLVLRNLVVASLGWIWLLIPWFWWHSNGDPLYIVYAVLVNVLFILAMVPEIQNRTANTNGRANTLEYGLSSLSSHPMGRGMLKMARAIGFMKEDNTGIKQHMPTKRVSCRSQRSTPFAIHWE